jgi:hypothetical protein
MIRNMSGTLGVLSGVLLMAASAWAQAFSSGSTGADGAYSPTVSGDFDPAVLGINASGDNVFNFTTINIPTGVIIKFKASKVRNAPVVFLATGNVTITGTLDLSGATPVTLNGSDFTQLVQNRVYPEPGPGGYVGGLGARSGVAAEAGAGPGGGPAGTVLTRAGGGGDASFYSIGTGYYSSPGVTYGSPYMVPLYGGSGGGGGYSATGISGIGGAGGGAIRIVSNTQISVTGGITTQGGNYGTTTGTGSSGAPGGSGSGGSVHLIAPTIAGTGTINAQSGVNLVGQQSNNGMIRFNVINNNHTGTRNGNFFYGPLYAVPANAILAVPTLTITQVNGVNVPNPPSGGYLTPDVQINANTPVTVNIAAANVPLGTVTTLRVTSETAGDQLISCSALAGTLATSTASCTATYPFSISINSLRANW